MDTLKLYEKKNRLKYNAVKLVLSVCEKNHFKYNYFVKVKKMQKYLPYQIALYYFLNQKGMTVREIAEIFSTRNYSNVSTHINNFKEQLKKSDELKKLLTEIKVLYRNLKVNK